MAGMYESYREAQQCIADIWTERDKGKFVICNVLEHTNKRVKVVAINPSMNEEDFRRFTLMTNTVKKDGCYLCSVESYKLDKNNNIILIVKPISFLYGFDYFDCVWDYLLAAGMVYEPYKKGGYGLGRREKISSLNFDSLYGMVDVPSEWPEVRKNQKVEEALAAGTITIKDVNAALMAPTELDLACEYVHDMMKYNVVEFSSKYPNLFKRVMSNEEAAGNLHNMMIKWRETYVFKGLGDSDSYVEQAEEVIAYYKSYNKTKKQIEKANKKAAKAV